MHILGGGPEEVIHESQLKPSKDGKGKTAFFKLLPSNVEDRLSEVLK